MAPQVVLSVGTDKHPFDRLVGWVDDWAAAHPDVEVFIQYGNSAAPTSAAGADLIPHSELLDMLRTATVVVSHGGPSTVMDIRACRRYPLVVGRNPAMGEHVDEHQMRFAEHLAKHGMATQVDTEEQLHGLIDKGLADPASLVLEVDTDGVPAGVRAFADHMNSLLTIPTEATR